MAEDHHEQRSGAGDQPPEPWYNNPWKAGLVGAVVFALIALVRVACAHGVTLP